MNSVAALKFSKFNPWEVIQSLITLTKPTIVLSFTLTGAAALVMEGSLLSNPTRFSLVILGLLFTAASANGLNQYLERDLDARMERTKKRRPLPQGKIHPTVALWFSLLLGVAAIWILAVNFNALSAWLAFGTIAFYILCYTLWLKPRTPYNIVIGGAAGATAPLIAWGAATGHLSLAALLLFLVIFTWTPPHFWALSLCVKEQYAKAGIPMMPVTKGLERTRLEILWYSIWLVPLSLSPYLFGLAGLLYFAGAFILGMFLLGLTVTLKIQRTRRAAFSLFRYSILYLMLLFILLIIDSQVVVELF